MSVTLEALGLDTDELRGEIVESAANKLLATYTEDSNDTLYRELREKFEEQLQAAVQPRVAEALTEAFEAEFTPTNQYGEPKPGATPMTLREYIGEVVQKHIKLGDNREGYSYDRNSENTISKWLNEEVAQHVRKELWSNYQAIADAVVERACATIRQQTDDALGRKKK